jgi:glycosyltransferase involved in cell wall biosynthesis
VADEIVAVDSGSADASVPILRKAGARVEHRAWSGYADQRNYCAGLATGDWVLFLDADERPDEELRQALKRLKQGPAPAENAFELAYKVFFFGRFLRYGGYFGERHLRLYRRGKARWNKREVHECLVCTGPVGLLAGYVEHNSYTTVGDYLLRLDRYSAEAARQMHAAGKTASGFTAWSHAAWTFMNRYLLGLGCLDGWEGYLAARLEALYTLIKYARLREMADERVERHP